MKLRLLAHDRYNIFDDRENAVANVRFFAGDTTVRFCTVLQNDIDHVCGYSAAAIHDQN